MRVKVEACIQGDLAEESGRYAAAAFQGGADTIELCGAMHLDGLTPPEDSIEAARAEFKRPGLMVMIRPRRGDFCYNENELLEMRSQIDYAARMKADGVVFGVLNNEAVIDELRVKELVELSRSYGLQTTFHRAFDAVEDLEKALETLINFGIDRVLTSGVGWGKSGSALDGAEQLNRTIQQSAGRIEVVVGGGVNSSNAPAILEQLTPWKGSLSMHAYSGVQESGETTKGKVGNLVSGVAPWNRD